MTKEQREKLKINLLKSGLELLNDKTSILIKKNVIIEMTHYILMNYPKLIILITSAKS